MARLPAGVAYLDRPTQDSGRLPAAPAEGPDQPLPLPAPVEVLRGRPERQGTPPRSAPAPQAAGAPRVQDIPRRIARPDTAVAPAPLDGLGPRAAEALAWLDAMVLSSRPFAERWAAFWHDLLAPADPEAARLGLVGAFHREVVRPLAFAPYGALLEAAYRHPARTRGLDAHAAPDAAGAALLDIHTVGPALGTPEDRREAGLALSGWRARRPGEPAANGFRFDETLHARGTRRVLGAVHPPAGEGQGRALFQTLAVRPETARHLAERLARHFLADAPDARAVAALADAWRASRGDLAHVARTLVALPALWAQPFGKLRSPRDLVVAALRGLSVRPDAGTLRALEAMGQPAHGGGDPQGADDLADTWAAPGRMPARLAFCLETARAHAGTADPDLLLRALLGPAAAGPTGRLVADAPGRMEALTLLLASPEMNRR
jgi:uncharacterized protein (DUF1800 family)